MNGASMASACATSSSPLVSAPSACPSPKKTADATRFWRRRTVSCRATGAGGSGRGDNNDGLLWLPRRDVMLNGLSSVAAGLAWYPGFASGEESPCKTADKVNEKVLLCTDAGTGEQKPCPRPYEPAPIDFNPVTRVRQPVHLLNLEYREKYKEAVGKMKALDKLDPSNPLGFKAQAAIHQAYCDSYYKYLTSSGSEKKFDVHFSWIFAPWHRMYIYFYEKALGDLIGDSTFALPYWNWDAPAGMVVPRLFKDKDSNGMMVDNPLYDPNRNEKQYLDALVDLDYQHEKKNNCSKYTPIPFDGPKIDPKYVDLVDKNLCTVYAQQVGKGPESFLGEKYCTDLKGGLDAPGMGTLERMAHTAMHVWTGRQNPVAGCSEADQGAVVGHDRKVHCQTDMGFLGTAANDPLFYSHHSNVDRMWHLWSTKLGGKAFDDPEWLDASFVFYDDVKSPRKVRIKVRDVLDTTQLGYTYDPKYDKDLPWMRVERKFLVPHPRGKDRDSGAAASSAAKEPEFLLQLRNCKVEVVPAVVVPPKDEGKEQLLVIEGIVFDPQKNNKFDVAINVPADKASQVGPQYKEYAGSFAVVPGSGGGKTRVCLCITNVLSDIEAKAGDSVDVIIVPRTTAEMTLNVRPTIKNRK